MNPPQNPEEQRHWSETELDPRPEHGQPILGPRDLPDTGIYREFRHLVASGEFLDGYFRALAKALRFGGEVRVTFDGGKILRTELREDWWNAKALGEVLRDEG